MTSRIVIRAGDLFKDSPKGAILIHACNCIGSWGGGIALAFKANFPDAYQVYRKHCEDQFEDPSKLLGTCLVIQDKEYDVGCLFTSVGHGLHVDPPEDILSATRSAVSDLLKQNKKLQKPLHACQFNSGLFRVPWEQTQAVLEELGASMTVHVPPEQMLSPGDDDKKRD